jgi:arsenite methyltransferase
VLTSTKYSSGSNLKSNDSYSFCDEEKNISVWDELPLWSAPFGLKLLDVVNYRKNIKVLDIGCGTGFPLIELAQRLGETSGFYGIDPWDSAISRLKEKIEILQLKNINLFDCKSEEMPFEDNFFNLIVSNNGINNAGNPSQVLNECYRTAADGAQLIITANLPGTFALFYETLTEILLQEEQYSVVKSLINHINQKRKSTKENIEMINQSGFKIRNIYEEQFVMRFMDGDAFLNHFFIKNNFVNIWIDLLKPTNCANYLLEQTKKKLNEMALESDLQMNVPFIVINSYK